MPIIAYYYEAKDYKCQDTSRPLKPERAGLDTDSADEAHGKDGFILKADFKVAHMKHLNANDVVAEEVVLD